MENELNALESKLALLIQSSSLLRAENHQLRQDLAQALSSNRLCNEQLAEAINDKQLCSEQLAEAASRNQLCNDKIESAKARLEKLLPTFPEDLS
jgi:cell division protein ZapB